MTSGLQTLLENPAAGGAAGVLVSVARVRGSAPRENGACMLVSADAVTGTIGGGALEYQAIAAARAALREDRPEAAWLRDYPLGPALGQCCGGVVTLLFERVAPEAAWIADCRRALARGEAGVLVASPDSGQPRRLVTAAGLDSDPDAALARPLLTDPDAAAGLVTAPGGAVRYLEPLLPHRPLYLFGAGHVGAALARVLSGLPFRTVWVDARAELFPPQPPAGIHIAAAPDPVALVAEAPPGSFFLVMTHDHGLDLELCTAILRRGDFAHIGLIGSESKRAQFLRRFRERGVPQDAVDRLVCPIGIGGITGKAPGQIAVAVAAEVEMRREILCSDKTLAGS